MKFFIVNWEEMVDFHQKKASKTVILFIIFIYMEDIFIGFFLLMTLNSLLDNITVFVTILNLPFLLNGITDDTIFFTLCAFIYAAFKATKAQPFNDFD